MRPARMRLHWIGWLVCLLALIEGGWLAYDGAHALVTGEYVTPSSGRYAGQLGPWSRLVAMLGIEPRSTLMKSIHLGLGSVWIGAMIGFVRCARWSWRAMIACAVLGLWYLPFGTLLSVIQIGLLLTPALRPPRATRRWPRKARAAPIYHLVVESELRAWQAGDDLRPASLDVEGFVHCATEASVLAVADDYFSGITQRLAVLRIDPARLSAATRFEPAAPLAGGGTTHLSSAATFPHVYGPIDADAVVGVGLLRVGNAGHDWPTAFVSLEEFRANR